ncbi:MAG: iron chelate uptake ABC transporter family permease subunit [Armatimonadetes bacterium]|nr:iron chelate uptake ABC transporter family permease subunit [Armatimonadota bacterium]
MRSRPLLVVGLVGCVLVVLAAGVFLGPAHLGAAEVWRALIAPGEVDGTTRAIVLGARLPRVCLGFVVGAALAVAGVIMQSFFQNPMAAPSIIGVSAGASLGATIALVTGLAQAAPYVALPAAAFVGALAAVVLVYGLARRGGRTPVATLLLTGIAVGSLASALASLLMIRAQRGDMDLVVFWMLGSLANRSWMHVAIVTPYVVLGVLGATAYARYLDVLALGDEQAAYLGLEVERVRLAFLAAAALLAAAAVAVTGVIGFVGLIVPHVARLLFGPQHRLLVPCAALAGMVTLAGADLIASLSGDIPVGIITAMMGAPFFLALLRRRELSSL